MGLATIVSTLILTKGILKVKQFTQEVISVTGSVEKRIVSNYATWRSKFTRRAKTLPEAFEQLKKDADQVAEYLMNQGIEASEIIVSPVATTVLYKKTEKGANTNEIEGYVVSQFYEVRSYDVAKVNRVALQADELIQRGVEFFSEAPQYFYTNLGDLKVEMLAAAIKNAKARAENMASASGGRVGLMRHARMGVFQITPVNSYDVSWYGNSDTSTLEKKVTAVVSADFALAQK